MSNYEEDSCKHKRKSITTHGRKSKGLHFCRKCGKRLHKKDFQRVNRPRERKVARRNK